MKPKLRILVVDDDRRMTRTLVDILSIAGYEAVEASSGSEALAKIRARTFNCVLTDVRMPGMDGVDFYRQLHKVSPSLPVMLMTAYAADETIQNGLDEGIVGVFDKPLHIKNILDFFSSLSKHRTVVIVDDDPNFCATLGKILQHRGFNVLKITDPNTDAELMAKNAEVILLDMKLDGRNGLDVLKEIRKLYSRLPVLLVTGYRREMSAAIEGALEINANACLYKPLEIPALLQMLEQFQTEHLREIKSQIEKKQS